MEGIKAIATEKGQHRAEKGMRDQIQTQVTAPGHTQTPPEAVPPIPAWLQANKLDARSPSPHFPALANLTPS